LRSTTWADRLRGLPLGPLQSAQQNLVRSRRAPLEDPMTDFGSLFVTSGLLHPYPYIPDDDLHLFPQLAEVPEGVVWHSGDLGKALGEYSTNEGDGRSIAYTFAVFARPPWNGALIQTVPLDRRAWHGGPGNIWWGAGLTGPHAQDPRSDLEQQLAQGLMLALRQAYPERVKYWCRHSDYEPSRRDPGPGFKAEWMEEIGFEWKLPPGCKLVRR
jgi:hypothetical protein